MSDFERYHTDIRKTLTQLSELREERVEEVRNSRSALVELDTGRVYKVSFGLHKMLGGVEGLEEGALLETIAHPDDVPMIREFDVSDAPRSEGHLELILRLLHADGSYRWHLWHAIGYKKVRSRPGHNPSPTRCICIALDISRSSVLAPLKELLATARSPNSSEAL